MAQKIVFGYWYVRGVGQIGRLLLAYTGADWEDVKYNTKPEWFQKAKGEVPLDFPNLPYLIDGDFNLTETTAIAYYIIGRSDKK